jgi:TolA-binding protein
MMDCARCEPVLLDLCYGELSPALEREVRGHVADCATCRKALARLESGQALARQLPEESVPPELTARIMKHARAHGRKRAWSFRIAQDWFEAIARVAMTRQVAMATLSLVIVCVGLWSLPELTRRRDSRNLVAEGEGPSHDVAPAPLPPSAAEAAEQPAELARAGAPKAAGAPKGRGEAGPAAARRAERPESTALARAESKQRERTADKRSALEPDLAAPALSAPAAEPELLEDQQVADALAERRARSENVQAPAASTAEADAPRLGAAAPATTASLEDIFKAGLERYRTGDYVAAVQLLSRMLESSAPSGQRAPALLYLARSERALGRCDRAIRAYETLVRSYGSSQQSAAALLEGVECYDRLGEPVGAQRLLEHATSVPLLATQASRALHERGVPRSDTSGDKPPAVTPR